MINIDKNFVNEVKKFKCKEEREKDAYIPQPYEYNVILKQKLKLNDLKKIKSHYRIKTSFTKKQDILNVIYNFLRTSYFSIKIQKNYRGYLVRKIFYLRGPYISEKKESVNETDFYSLDDIKDIHVNQLISFKDDVDKKVYVFTVNSLYKLIREYKKNTNNELLNPYTRNKLPKNIINQLSSLMRLCKIYKIKIISDDDLKPIKLTKQQRFDQRVTNVFNTMDSLGNYTQINWFFELNTTSKNIKFIRELYDIWSYRAQLTQDVKNRICNFSDPFIALNLHSITNLNFDMLNNISLTLIEKFVNSGINTEDRALGAYYILTALTLVSQNAANALPWLYESVVTHH